MPAKAAPVAEQKQSLLSKEVTDKIAADVSQQVSQQVASGVVQQVQAKAGEYASQAADAVKNKAADLWNEQVRGGKLDGPMPLRALCFLGGIALIAVGALGLLNVFNAIFAPASFILHAYQVLFGGMIIMVEGKNLGSWADSWRNMVDKYFFFLSLMGGRGGFYILVGTIAVSSMGIFDIAVGLYMVFLGVICVMVHFHLEKQLSSEITQRIAVDTQP